MSVFRVADLFAGAGGMSEGCEQAARARGVATSIVAVNHWPVAVATHAANHPGALHYCTPVEAVDPRDAVPGGKLDLLMASPECTHHSTARGGKPINDQSRASAWHIMRWLELLRVEALVIENVPEFQTWGRLGANGRPLASAKGQIFQSFVETLRRYGFRVEYRVLNAADYGAATTRKRLFIVGVRGNRKVPWPKPTHAQAPETLPFGSPRRPWRAAREVIDWTLSGQSIFGRKRPLKPATMRRILEGLRRFGGPDLAPFLVQMTHGGRVYSVGRTVPTVTTTKGGDLALVEPFLLGQQSGAVPRPVSAPVPTVATDGAIALVNPFITKYYGTATGAKSVDDPLETVTAKDRFGLVMPVVEGRALDIRFRMLQPHELAAAMSFPPTYQFQGTKTDQVRMIGNAVDCSMSMALSGAVMDALRGHATWREEAIA